jgi:hypothetical protein
MPVDIDLLQRSVGEFFEQFGDVAEDIRVADEFVVEILAEGFLGDVVFGRAKAACDNNEVDLVLQFGKRVENVLLVVGNRNHFEDFDADLI